MDLKAVDSKALLEELARRGRDEKERRDAFNARRRDLQEAALTPEVLKALAPEHERTSCSDEDLINGWGSHSSGTARCLRCALLQGPVDGYHFELKIERDWVR